MVGRCLPVRSSTADGPPMPAEVQPMLAAPRRGDSARGHGPGDAVGASTCGGGAVRCVTPIRDAGEFAGFALGVEGCHAGCGVPGCGGRAKVSRGLARCLRSGGGGWRCGRWLRRTLPGWGCPRWGVPTSGPGGLVDASGTAKIAPLFRRVRHGFLRRRRRGDMAQKQ